MGVIMASSKGNNVVRALNWRYATKKFDPKRKVSEADLAVLMESLRLAPSSMGVQPWAFLLITDKKTKDRLSAACYGQQQVKDASHVFVICSIKELAGKHLSRYFESVCIANPEKSLAGKAAQAARLADYRKMIEGYSLSMGKERTSQWCREQCYIALGFLLSACAHLNIDSCPIEGYNKAEVEKLLGLPEKGLQAATVVPVGYRAKDDAHARENKVRFSKEEVFLGI